MEPEVVRNEGLAIAEISSSPQKHSQCPSPSVTKGRACCTAVGQQLPTRTFLAEDKMSNLFEDDGVNFLCTTLLGSTTKTAWERQTL